MATYKCRGSIDKKLLKRQLTSLGRIVDNKKITKKERKNLEGLWEMGHSMLDCSE